MTRVLFAIFLVAHVPGRGAPRLPPTIFCRLLLEPEHFMMERAMLRRIKRWAEAALG